MAVERPANCPELGFYYHYKHDPNGSVNNYAYEVIGVGAHTEEDGRFFVVYRPLDSQSPVYQAGKLFDLRPLDMFMGEVEVEGQMVPRFRRVEDARFIRYLTKLK